jgi:hypothetical protein
VPPSVTLVCDEPPGMFLAQQAGDVPSLLGIDLEESAQLVCRSTKLLEGAPSAWATRGAQDLGQVVPEHVPQPPLRDARDVEVAHRVDEAATEVIGFDEAGVAGVQGAVVDAAEAVDDLAGNHPQHVLAVVAQCRAAVPVSIDIEE